MKQIVYLCAFACLILVSCTSDVIEPKEPIIPDQVSFSANVQPLFSLSCNITGCHAPGGKSPDLSPGVAYENLSLYGLVDVDAPASSTIYVKITTGSMKQYAKTGDAEIILKWIEQGALDN